MTCNSLGFEKPHVQVGFYCQNPYSFSPSKMANCAIGLPVLVNQEEME